MVRRIIHGDWNDLRRKLKQRFDNLTDNDLILLEGKEDELIRRLHKKTGKTKPQIRKLLQKLN